MLTHIHYENFKPNFMKNQRINASHWIPNYRKWITQKPTYTCQQCSHISQHSNIYKYQNQRQRRSNQDYFHQEFLERIHLGWIDPYSMQRYYSKLRTRYRFVYSTLSRKQQL